MRIRDKEKQREYARRHYEVNREKMKTRAVESKKKQVQLLRDYVTRYKEERPCVDCDKSYPHYVMDLDHCNGKKITNVSTAIYRGWSLERLKQEIAKCEIRCANCHRIKTYSCGVEQSGSSSGS